VVLYHGGAFQFGSPRSYDAHARYIAASTGAVVVVPDYRMVPEDPFPGAWEDAVAAFSWTAENAASLGVDAHRIAVAGDSAGGNLAAAVSQWARDHGSVEPVLQLLFYPWVDLAAQTDSIERLPTGYIIEKKAIATAGVTYGAAAGVLAPEVSPSRGNLDGVAPALVITGGYDPLQDQGTAYADALALAGVEVEQIHYPTVTHAFVSMAGVLEEGRAGLDAGVHALSQAFGGSPRQPVLDDGLARKQAIDSLNEAIALLTAEWTPAEKSALQRLMNTLDDLAGSDGRVNYGDKGAILAAILSDTPGIINQSQEEIYKRLGHRPLIAGLASRVVENSFQPSRRLLPGRRARQNRRRARRRGKILGLTAQVTSSMLDDLLRELGVDPATAQRPDLLPRDITIGQMKAIETDIAALAPRLEGLGGGANIGDVAPLMDLLRDAQRGTGRFSKPPLRQGLPSTKELRGALEDFVESAPRHTPPPRGAYLGVQATAYQDGVWIRKVTPGSAAARAGLKPSDVILSVDGEKVQTFDQLSRVIQSREPGQRVDVRFLRDGRLWKAGPVLQGR
jgi:acetyl esterase